MKDYAASGEEAAYAIFLDSEDIGDAADIVIEGNTVICTALNQIGVGLFPTCRVGPLPIVLVSDAAARSQ